MNKNFTGIVTSAIEWRIGERLARLYPGRAWQLNLNTDDTTTVTTIDGQTPVVQACARAHARGLNILVDWRVTVGGTSDAGTFSIPQEHKPIVKNTRIDVEQTLTLGRKQLPHILKEGVRSPSAI